MCEIAHFLVLSWILLHIFCFSHHSLWTLEMVVQENCRSAVSEVLGPARLTPTNTAATVWKDEINCRKLKKTKNPAISLFLVSTSLILKGGVFWFLGFFAEKQHLPFRRRLKHIRHQYRLVAVVTSQLAPDTKDAVTIKKPLSSQCQQWAKLANSSLEKSTYHKCQKTTGSQHNTDCSCGTLFATGLASPKAKVSGLAADHIS